MEKNKTRDLLYQAYLKFYGRKPNLTSASLRDLTIEFQAMAYLLSQYGIYFGSGVFAGNCYVDLDMPMSMELQDVLIDELIGKEESCFALEGRFSDRTERIIQIIGSEMQACESVEMIRLFAQICFTKERVLPLADDEEILSYIRASREDMEKYLEFVANIMNGLSNENGDSENLASIKVGTEDNDIPGDVYGPHLDETSTGRVIMGDGSRKIVARELIK